MDKESVAKFIELNKKFYNTIGEYFNHSREYSWEGWDSLKTYINAIGQDVKVLDIGCGNGRFFDFLAGNFDKQTINYVGIDNSEFLLEEARTKFDKNKNCNFLNSEILFGNWDQKLLELGYTKYNLIVLFGVMHHIPSMQYRQNLIKKAASLLNDNGYLVLTTWQYRDVPRLQKRILSKNSDLVKEILSQNGLSISNLEEGDNILDWQKGKIGYRYSHYYTKSEIKKILTINQLKVTKSYFADGREGNINQYFIIQKQ